MNVTFKYGPLWASLLLLVLLLTFLAWPSEKVAPLWTLHADPYKIEILTPGGVFRRGHNLVQVRAWRGDQPMALRQGRVGLSMLWLDRKPHMHAQAILSRHRSSSALEGGLHFDMTGFWDGWIRVTTPTGPVAGVFRTEVVK